MSHNSNQDDSMLPPELQPGPPVGRLVIRETWLTRKPAYTAILVAALATFALVLASLIGWSNTDYSASRRLVFENHEYWRLWSTVFVHGDAAHLASNAFLFFIFAFFLNGHFGFWVFPIGAFFFGGLANAWVLTSYSPDVRLVGASGVVYWCGGAWLMFYFFLSRQKNLRNRILRSLGVAVLLFMPAETFQPNVSHETHFAGFVLGVTFACAMYFVNRSKYLSAEVIEMIYEDRDPADDLPGPDGPVAVVTPVQRSDRDD